MKNVCVIIFIILLSFLLIDCTTMPSRSGILARYGISYNDKHFLHERSDVHIYWELKGELLPPSWYEEPYNIQMTPVSRKELARSLEIVISELEKYPPQVLRAYLEEVYLLDSFFCWGEESGGLFWAIKVFLVNRGEKNDYIDM